MPVAPALNFPSQPRDRRVVLPAVPANPPTDTDLKDALKYKQLVVSSAGSFADNCSTTADVGQAMVYEHSVTHARALAVPGAALAPLWFAPVQQQLDRFQQQLNRMEANHAKMSNAANDDGSTYPFVIVPFINGDDPTANGLPRLSSAADVNNLSAADATAYLTGYGVVNIPRAVVARRRLVKIAIGCRVL